MKKIIQTIILYSLFLICNIAHANNFTNQGQQYTKKLTKIFTKTDSIKIEQKVDNIQSFLMQIEKIKNFSSSLYLKNKSTYEKIINWIKNNPSINKFNKFNINAFQMKGVDNYGNVKISGYYTPIIEARKTKQDNFIYPIYSMPYRLNKNQSLPKRKDIYNGILDKKYILAYSNSLIENFIMEIQGSAFIDYGNNKPTFFSYAGKNNWPYKGIGQILINRGEIKKKNMSMQTIKNWCKTHTKKQIQNLFEKNESFVFFKETNKKYAYGSSAIPLIAKASIASDRSIIKNGSVVLLQIPILNKNGIFIHQYEMRLVVALDVGGAIKGQHFDIYEGIGKEAATLAGFYNHYGYAWLLTDK